MSAFLAPVRSVNVHSLIAGKENASASSSTGSAASLLQPVKALGASSLIPGATSSSASSSTSGASLLMPVKPVGVSSLIAGSNKEASAKSRGALPALKPVGPGKLATLISGAGPSSSSKGGCKGKVVPPRLHHSWQSQQPDVDVGDLGGQAEARAAMLEERQEQVRALLRPDPPNIEARKEADLAAVGSTSSREEAVGSTSSRQEADGVSSHNLDASASSATASHPSDLPGKSESAASISSADAGAPASSLFPVSPLASPEPLTSPVPLASPSPGPLASPASSPDSDSEEALEDTGVAMADKIDTKSQEKNTASPPVLCESDLLDKAAATLLAEVPKNKHHIFVTSPPGVGKTTLVQKLLERLQEDEGKDATDILGFYTEEVRDASGQRMGFDVVRVGSVSADMPPRMGLARVGQEQPKVGKYTVDVAGFDAFALPALGVQLPELPENPRLYTKPDGTVEAVSLVETSQTLQTKISCAACGATIGADYKFCDECGAKVVDTKQEEAESWTILVPSTGEQEVVSDPTCLEPVPDGWRPPKPPKAAGEEQRPRLCVCDEVGKMALLSLKFGPEFLTALDEDTVILGTIPQPARGQRDHQVVEQVKKRKDVKIARMTRGNRDQLVEQVYGWLKESLGFEPPGGETRAAKRRRLELEAEADRKAAAENEARAAQAAKDREAALARKEEKKAAKAEEKKAKKDKKAKKKEEERLAGLKRAAERKKRREELLEAAKSTAKNPMQVEDEEEVEMVKVDPYQLDQDMGAEDDVQLTDNMEVKVAEGLSVVSAAQAAVPFAVASVQKASAVPVASTAAKKSVSPVASAVPTIAAAPSTATKRPRNVVLLDDS